MRIAEYKTGQSYDDGFKHVMDICKRDISNKEDDFILLCVGTTGTGKSHLMLHGLEYYLGDEASIDYVGLNPKDFSTALKVTTEKQLPRFLSYDEANISRRDHSSNWNKRLLDLYYAIRGLQIFHWWNNPSADIIDKPFIKERVKGLIFIFTKSKDKPRLYYYFTKKGLLNIYDKYGNISLNTLKKYGKNYAFYRGWFTVYNGFLLEQYNNKKASRMIEKVGDFYKEFGGESWAQSEIAKECGVDPKTVSRHVHKLIDNNELVIDRDYTENIQGRKLFNRTGKDKIIFSISN